MKYGDFQSVPAKQGLVRAGNPVDSSPGRDR
jgi:hypothetical protein